MADEETEDVAFDFPEEDIDAQDVDDVEEAEEAEVSEVAEEGDEVAVGDTDPLVPADVSVEDVTVEDEDPGTEAEAEAAAYRASVQLVTNASGELVEVKEG